VTWSDDDSLESNNAGQTLLFVLNEIERLEGKRVISDTQFGIEEGHVLGNRLDEVSVEDARCRGDVSRQVRTKETPVKRCELVTHLQLECCVCKQMPPMRERRHLEAVIEVLLSRSAGLGCGGRRVKKSVSGTLSIVVALADRQERVVRLIENGSR
jgi:hypothetical protein